MIRRLSFFLLILAFAVLVSGTTYAAGYFVSRQLYPPAPSFDGGAPTEWKASFPVFWEAWNYVQQDFYKSDISSADLVNGAITGMVRSLGDPFTGYANAKRAAITSTDLQGSFEGIGATIEMREGRLTIVSPIKDSPAERAGLLPNDVILQVGQTPIQNMTVDDAIALIRGPKGTTIQLMVQRAKQPNFTVTIVRDVIRTPFVESRMIEGTSIAYLRLNQFGSTAPDELDTALRALLAQKPTGLILDLRRDPGGYLSAAIDVASEFLKSGDLVMIEKDKDGHATNLSAKGYGAATDIPMVLLIDGGSASASEILAGALQDHKRATLIGVKTFGKGSVQNVHSLSDKSELRVTIAHFFSPNGNEIHTVGISPDIEVKITEDDTANKRDPQLDRAIQFLKNGQ